MKANRTTLNWMSLLFAVIATCLLTARSFALREVGPTQAAALPLAQMPPDARDLFDRFEREQAVARQELETRLAAQRKELIAQLKTLQERYTRAGQVNEAAAIGQRVGQLVLDSGGDLENPLPETTRLEAFRNRIGQTLYVRVIGQPGSVWGTDVYTDDSSVSTVAVHAGIIKLYQETVVRVTLQPGRAAYDGASRNGITSNPYGPWQGSYIIEAVPGAKVTDHPELADQTGRQSTPRREGTPDGLP